MEKLTPAEARQKIWEHQEREKCRKKNRYNDEGSALSSAHYHNEVDKKTRRAKQKSRPYKCPWCGFYHLTRNTPR